MALKLISMHHLPGEGECTPQPICSPAGSDYPYGLRMTLGEEQLKALGLELPPAGTCLHIEACAVVTRSATEDPDADGDIDYVCLEMQVTQLGVEVEGDLTDEDDDEDPLEERRVAGRRLYAKAGTGE